MTAVSWLPRPRLPYTPQMDKRYQARLAEVLRYIEDHLDQRLSLADVAAVSHFSPYHFHRIFRGAMGETLNDYIGRRRLERAINILVFYPDRPITEVALSNGFSSSANFAKAVRLHFGYSPSEIRQPEKIKDSKIGKVLSKYGKDFDPHSLYPYRDLAAGTIGTDWDRSIEVRALDELAVVVLGSEGGYQAEALQATWRRLIAWADRAGIADADQQRFGICYDNPAVTPLDKCRYEAAVVIDSDQEVRPPFQRGQIPAGRYAVLHYRGPAEKTSEAQLGLYTGWLPDSGYEPAPFPLMERYLNVAAAGEPVEIEFYIKLRHLS